MSFLAEIRKTNEYRAVDLLGGRRMANPEMFELHEYNEPCKLIRTLSLNGYIRRICVVKDIVYIEISSSRNISGSKIGHATIVAIKRDLFYCSNLEV